MSDDRRGIDRRAAFFVVAALACFALAPVSEAEFRWVCISLGVVYVVLAVASALDARTKARQATTSAPAPPSADG